MTKKFFLTACLGCEMRARKGGVKPIFRHWATAAVIALAALAIQAQSCAKSPSYGSNAASAPCAPHAAVVGDAAANAGGRRLRAPPPRARPPVSGRQRARGPTALTRRAAAPR